MDARRWESGSEGAVAMRMLSLAVALPLKRKP
jgi:hypothetical protein